MAGVNLTITVTDAAEVAYLLRKLDEYRVEKNPNLPTPAELSLYAVCYRCGPRSTKVIELRP